MLINKKFFVSGFKGLMHRAPNMDTLVALGSGASFVYSLYALFAMTGAQAAGEFEHAMHLMHEFYFESAAMILTLITVGKMLEAMSKGRTTDALKKLIYNYGEERFAPKIANAIVARREKEPIATTGQLVDVIKSAIPAAAREGGHHPAKRTFQAIRIEVNGELDAIEPAIRNAADILAPEGRIAIITFHSLEDRIVKQTYADLASGCTCPKSLPICVCGKKPSVSVLTRKPILPSEAEVEGNPRSRSAKLRVAEKL
jgi:16S rRNA (cytosine(1402)-N(4))-methyltransferase